MIGKTVSHYKIIEKKLKPPLLSNIIISARFMKSTRPQRDKSSLCMDYYGGKTLQKKIQCGPQPIEETIEIAMQVASS